MKEKVGGEKLFKSSEEVVSMFLGLLVVMVVVGLVVNMVQRGKGSVSIPGISDSKALSSTTSEVKVIDKEEKKVVEREYVVVRGDSLWKIAERIFGDGNKWTAIQAKNNLKSPGLLYAGQQLLLPEVKTVKSDTIDRQVESGKDYVVVKGDSLWKISLQAYGDGYRWVDIWKQNRALLVIPDRLEIGMKLMIPGNK